MICTCVHTYVQIWITNYTERVSENSKLIAERVNELGRKYTGGISEYTVLWNGWG